MATITNNGGGATHIAKVTGQLSSLSNNLSDILMVSGGGGGGLLVDDTDYSGKEAGGISGSGDNSADQSTGNAFGQGESGTNVSGGGSGLYGGYKGTSSKSGGAGSGYIGNSLVSNKKMVGYNVPTSSAEGTKTESVNEASESPVSGKPKAGNGHARIKFLRELEYREIILPTEQMVDLRPTGTLNWTWLHNIPSERVQPYLYDDSLLIFSGQSNGTRLIYENGVYHYPTNIVNYNNSVFWYYLGGIKHIYKGKIKYRNNSGNNFPRLDIYFENSITQENKQFLYIDSGVVTTDFIPFENNEIDFKGDYLRIRLAMDSFDFKDIEIMYDES